MIKQEKQLRKPRILWATPYCLLDTSSGAAISSREMLRQLVFNGYEVVVIGATVFDSEKGLSKLPSNWQSIIGNNKLIRVKDTPLVHNLLVTAQRMRSQLSVQEADTWYALYIQALDTFKPDLVWFYGGQPLELLISEAAKERGIPCAAYLANASYQGKRWCRDVDVIITNSQANADFYERQEGLKSIPVGVFVDPSTVIASRHTRKNILFINPSLEKGAGIVIQLAMMLEKNRPDIQFEVLESRGNWQILVEQVTNHYGEKREKLDNVMITSNTGDMRPIYSRARLLLAPSLWWESAGRIVVEAMLNAIPAIVTDRGGLPEMMGRGGIKVQLPEVYYEKPYTLYPNHELLRPLAEKIIQFYDDEVFYREYVSRARFTGERFHNLSSDTLKLMQAFEPFIQKRTGG